MGALINNRVALTMESEKTLEYSVLVISSDLLMTELLCDVLADSKVEACHAYSLLEAREAVLARRPQLILIDWDAEGEDTIAIYRQLRKSMRLGDVPAILMTDRTVTQGLRSNLSCDGIRWVLEKPIVPTGLPKLIKTTICEADINARRPQMSYRLAPRIHAGESASGAMWQKI